MYTRAYVCTFTRGIHDVYMMYMRIPIPVYLYVFLYSRLRAYVQPSKKCARDRTPCPAANTACQRGLSEGNGAVATKAQEVCRLVLLGLRAGLVFSGGLNCAASAAQTVTMAWFVALVLPVKQFCKHGGWALCTKQPSQAKGLTRPPKPEGP